MSLSIYFIIDDILFLVLECIFLTLRWRVEMSVERIRVLMEGLARLSVGSGVLLNSGGLELGVHDFDSGRYLGVLIFDDESISFFIDPDGDAEMRIEVDSVDPVDSVD